MPGPKSTTPRKPGPRPDQNGNPRKPNAKQAARLAARVAAVPKTNDKFSGGWNTPGSQNRHKK